MIAILLIAFGGFLGAICRYTISKWVKSDNIQYPIGTLMVNLLGSFLLGIVAAKNISGSFYSFFGIGFLGAFTTFSTMNMEVIQFIGEKKVYKAIIYLTLSYLIGIPLAYIGFIYTK